MNTLLINLWWWKLVMLPLPCLEYLGYSATQSTSRYYFILSVNYNWSRQFCVRVTVTVTGTMYRALINPSFHAHINLCCKYLCKFVSHYTNNRLLNTLELFIIIEKLSWVVMLYYWKHSFEPHIDREMITTLMMHKWH